MTSPRFLWLVNSAAERAQAEACLSANTLTTVDILDLEADDSSRLPECAGVLVSQCVPMDRWPKPSRDQVWIWVSDTARSPDQVAAFFAWGGRTLMAPSELTDAALGSLSASRIKRGEEDVSLTASSPAQWEAREIKRELLLAGQVQAAILPGAPLETSTFLIDHEWRPSAGLSGDFVRYQRIGSGQVVFLLADVAGHGAGSALVTVMLDERLNRILEARESSERGENARSQSRVNAVDIVRQLNDAMVEGAFEQHVAMVLGIIEEDEGRLDWVSAGHYPPAFLRNGDETATLPTGGLPLGLLKDAEYDAHQLTLRGEFRLMIFSDGVLEVVSGDSLERQEAALEAMVHDFRGHTHQAIPTLTQGRDVVFADDVTVLSVASR